MSTDNHHYPQLDENALDLAIRIFENNPGYFEAPGCPYTKRTKEILKGTGKFRDFDSHADLTQIPEAADLISQVNILSKELKEYGQSITGNSESSASDKNTYFRLSTTLLEKLLDLKERTVKVKEYEAFTTAVLDIMEKELTPDQRQVVMTRLESLIEQKETKGSKVNEDITD